MIRVPEMDNENQGATMDDVNHKRHRRKRKKKKKKTMKTNVRRGFTGKFGQRETQSGPGPLAQHDFRRVSES